MRLQRLKHQVGVAAVGVTIKNVAPAYPESSDRVAAVIREDLEILWSERRG